MKKTILILTAITFGATTPYAISQTPNKKEPEKATPAKQNPPKKGEKTTDTPEKSEITSDQKRVLEPYPANPTGNPPAGWKIKLLPNSKVENKTEIEPGKEITVSVEAYTLEPIALENETIIVLNDPFYNPLLKNAQEKTLGASITKYSEESEILRNNLHAVIQSLEKDLKIVEKTPENKEVKPKSSDSTKTKK